MIDVKDAVQAARAYAREVLGENESTTVEEIERDVYKNHEVWRITLGFSGRWRIGTSGKEYKSFIIDAQSGEALAMKIRELTN
jgi:hypothetical protein